MAEFCFEAARVMWGDGAKNDFVGMCKPGEAMMVLCEGMDRECPGGFHLVDHDGKAVPEPRYEFVLYHEGGALFLDRIGPQNAGMPIIEVGITAEDLLVSVEEMRSDAYFDQQYPCGFTNLLEKRVAHV